MGLQCRPLLTTAFQHFAWFRGIEFHHLPESGLSERGRDFSPGLLRVGSGLKSLPRSLRLSLRFDEKGQRCANDQKHARGDEGGLEAAAAAGGEHLLDAGENEPADAPGAEEDAVVEAEILDAPEVLGEGGEKSERFAP